MFLYDQLRKDIVQDPLHDQSSSNSALDLENKIEFVYEDIQMPTENNGSDAASTSRIGKRKFEEVSSDNMDNKEYQQHKNNVESEDEDMCFFKSLVPHVKQLSPQKKMLMRIKIQELVYKEVYSTDLE